MPNLCIIPARALQDPDLTGGDIRVLCAIGLHTDREGAGCWASSKTLAQEAGVSERSFFYAVKRLLEKELITVKSGKDAGTTCSYSIDLSDHREGKPKIADPLCNGLQTPLQLSADQVRKGVQTTTINAPFNDPSNAPTTKRGGKLVAAELLKEIRQQRNPQFPTSLNPNWTEGFSDREIRVVRAVGVERILSTLPANEGPLLAQTAAMLEEVHA